MQEELRDRRSRTESFMLPVRWDLRWTMGFCNHRQEICLESEMDIIREVFPELLEATELNEAMESEAGRRRSMSFTSTRRQLMAGHAGRRGFYRHRSRWPVRRFGYAHNPNVRTSSPQDTAFAQSCLAQVLGPWVRQTSRFDAVTKRAIRLFQSR